MAKTLPPLEFKSGYYYSPGFYQEYWLDHIQDKIPNHDSFSNNKLKQYQELWIGSIFAALYTKSTEVKYFVGLPEKEPPDVYVVRLVPMIRNKRECNELERIPVEITRCHLGESENLFDQILKKNKSAYNNTILLVYLYGTGNVVCFDNLVVQLSNQPRVHPSEIYILAKVDNNSSKQNTFVGTMVYPEYRTQSVDLSDNNAFFTHPEVVTKKLWFGRELKPAETRIVLPPNA